MAQTNEYDTSYILSADGDYTYAAEFVKAQGKKLFAVATTSRGAQLAAVVNKFIRIDATWFNDCYKWPTPFQPFRRFLDGERHAAERFSL